MTVLGLDPGTDKTAWVEWNGLHVFKHGIWDNEDILNLVEKTRCDRIFCEMIASYGMAVGRSTFETVYWIGRFADRAYRAGRPFQRVFRLDVKTHLCKSAKAKDANVRQALIDRIGEQGTKKNPGPTYGISSHVWAALAVAVYGLDKLNAREGHPAPESLTYDFPARQTPRTTDSGG